MKRIAIILIASLLVLLSLPMVLLQIGAVSERVAHYLSSKASQKTGLEISIEKIDLYFPLVFALEEVSLSKEGRPILSSQRVTLAWSPFALLRKELHFPFVKSPQVTLYPSDEEELPSLAWPCLPIAIQIDSIQIDKVVRGAADWQLEEGLVAIEAHGGDFSLHASLRSLDERRAHVEIEMRGDAANCEIELVGTGRKPTGWGPAPEINIHRMTVRLSGSLPEWQQMRLKGEVAGTVGLEPTFSLLYDLVGEESEVEADFLLEGREAVRIIAAQAVSRTAYIAGAGRFASGSMGGHFTGKLFELSALNSLDPIDLKGTLDLSGTYSGSLDLPNIHVGISSPIVQVQGLSIYSVHGELQATRPDGLWQGAVAAQGSPSTLPLHLSLQFSEERSGCWLIDKVQLAGEGAQLAGWARLCPQRQLSEGELRGAVTSLAPWSIPAQADLAGYGNLSILLTPQSSEGPQIAKIGLQAREVVVNTFEAGDLDLQLLVFNPLVGIPVGEIRLAGKELSYGSAHFRQAEVTLLPGIGRWRFSGKTIGEPQLDFTGAWIRAPHLTTITLDQLEGSASGQTISLGEPVTLSWSHNGSLFLSPLDLTAGAGTLQASASLTPDASEARVSLDHFPLSLLVWADPRLDFLGEATGQLTFEGDAHSTEGQTALNWEGLQLKGRSHPINGSLHALLSGDTLQLELESTATRSGAPVHLSLNLPLTLVLAPMHATIAPDQPLSGVARYKGEIGPWLRTFLFRDALVTGQLDIDLGAKGTLDAIELVGEAVATQVTYENLNTGTRLCNLAARIVGEGEELQLRELTGVDGQGGSLSATGHLSVLPDQGFPFEIDVELNQTHLVQLDEAQAALSGQLRIHGTPTRPVATGDLTVVEAQLAIPSRLPACVPTLPVTYVNVPQLLTPEEVVEPLRAALFSLEIALHFPGTLCVDGRGLTSSWEGDLDIGGTTETLRVTGRLDLVRGCFNFSHRSFCLVKGTIGFTGPLSLTSLELVGTLRSEGIDVIASLVGPLANPKLSLTSIPPLCLREILAYLLFDTPIDELSPFQALTLAAAVNELAGGTMLPNPIETIRRTLRLDHICVVRPDASTDEVGIEAGRHLGCHSYITLYRSVREQYDHMLIEIDLSEQFQVFGESRDTEGETVGIRWKKDY